MHQKNSQRSGKPALWILIYLSSLVPFFIILPEIAVPKLSVFFRLPIASVEWVISLCGLAYALGALIYCPFTHFLGKKKTLILFFVIGLIGAACSVFSFVESNFILLLLGRALLCFWYWLRTCG